MSRTLIIRIFALATIVWAAALPAAAYAASRPSRSWYPFAFAVYAAGSLVCHQLPARSFTMWAAQMPVCARCTGIYLGGAVGAIAALVTRRPSTRSAGRLAFALAAMPTALTLACEWTTGEMPANSIRALSGIPLGGAVVWIVTAGTGQPRKRRLRPCPPRKRAARRRRGITSRGPQRGSRAGVAVGGGGAPRESNQ